MLVVLLLAAISGVAIMRKGPSRLDRAIAAAAVYDMVDGSKPATTAELRALEVTISDWLSRFATGSTPFTTASDIPEEGVVDLLCVGKEIRAKCVGPGRVIVEVPGYDSPTHDFFKFVTIANLLASIAEGEASDVGLEERFEAVVAILHLGEVLTDRHFSGVLLGGAMVGLARGGFDACIRDGLVIDPAQRASLLAALERFDFVGKTREAHRAVIVRLLSKASDSPVARASALRRFMDRVIGRTLDDRVLSLQLVVATQQSLHGESQMPGQKSRKDLLAEIGALNRVSYPQAHVAATLSTRVDKVRDVARSVAAWVVQLK